MQMTVFSGFFFNIYIFRETKAFSKRFVQRVAEIETKMLKLKTLVMKRLFNAMPNLENEFFE